MSGLFKISTTNIFDMHAIRFQYGYTIVLRLIHGDIISRIFFLKQININICKII
jgi:hypothetical protein